MSSKMKYLESNHRRNKTATAVSGIASISAKLRYLGVGGIVSAVWLCVYAAANLLAGQ